LKKKIKLNYMNLYLIRHGESSGNEKRIHQDENDPLTENGIIQVHQLADRLKKMDINAICTSPYLRAKQSAEIISKALSLPIQYIDELKERKRPSEIEGLGYDDSLAKKINLITKQKQASTDWKYSDDESYNEILSRAIVMEEFLTSQYSNQNIICVTHVAIMTLIVLHCILKEKLTPEIYWNFYHHAHHNNAGITKLEHFDSSGWRLITWNDTHHL